MSDEDDRASALAAKFLEYVHGRGSAEPSFTGADLKRVRLPAFMSAIVAGITEEAARLRPWVTAEDVEDARFPTLDGPTLASLNEHLTGCFRAWRCHQVESAVYATQSALIGSKAEIDAAEKRISRATTTLIDGIFRESTRPEFKPTAVLADRIRAELCAEGHDLEAVVACLLAIQDISTKVATRGIQSREDWNKIAKGEHDEFGKIRKPDTLLTELVGMTLAHFDPENEGSLPTKFTTTHGASGNVYSGPMIDLAVIVLKRMGLDTSTKTIGRTWKELASTNSETLKYWKAIKASLPKPFQN